MDYTTIDFKKFPTTRYQGSKRKILHWICEHLKGLKFQTALDGFGGSGSVSYLLKRMGKTVHYNDKLVFNSLIGKALIENDTEILTSEDINDLLTKKDISGFDFIQNNFKEVYYLDSENEIFDSIVGNIHTMNHYSENVLGYKKALSYYVLFQTSIIKRPYNLFHRKNLNIRTADVKRNFGNKVTWDRPIEEYIHRFASEVNRCVFSNGHSCKSLNQSVFEVDPYGYDLVYLDPPYVSSNRNDSSNYLKGYHFLEGMANYTEWGEKIDYQTGNLRLKENQELYEFRSSIIKERLDEVIERYKKSIIVLSYKVGGKPTIEELENSVKKVKKKVYTVDLHYKYALNKQNGNAALNREFLIIGVD